MSLEEKVVIVLYEVFENGRFIESDAPFNGMQRPYGNWSTSHGIYRSRQDAEAARHKLVKKRLAKGYSQHKDDPYRLFSSYRSDIAFGIDVLHIDKDRITDRQDGTYWYAGRRIR
jgi:hypothetical protein